MKTTFYPSKTDLELRKAFEIADTIANRFVDNFWSILDHPEFPFVALTSTTNGARNFPPYNIIEQKDGKVRLEMAVAGYQKDRLKVELDGNILLVSAEPSNTCADAEIMRHQSICDSKFLRTFELKPNSTVESVSLADGILSILVSLKVPENKKPLAFDIK